MVKIICITFLLFWQLFPVSCDQALTRALRIVDWCQIHTNGPLSKTIKNDTEVDNPNPLRTPARQSFSNSKVKTADNDAGLFTTTFCKIIDNVRR